MSTWLRLQRPHTCTVGCQRAWRCYMLIKFNVLIDRAADKHRAAQQNASRSKFMQHKKEGWWWSVEAERHSRRRDALWGRDVNHDSLSLRAYWTQSRFLFFCCWQKLREDDLTQNNHSQSDLDATMAQKQHQTDLLFIKVIGSSVFNNDIRPFSQSLSQTCFCTMDCLLIVKKYFFNLP